MSLRIPSYRPITEDHPKDPDDLYGTTKLVLEQVCEEYRRKYGVDCLILRFAFYYAPGKSRHGSFSIHSKLIENAMNGVATEVPQGREERDDTIYIGDVARGVINALFVKDPHSKVFNIGTGNRVSLVEMSAVLRAIYPGAHITIGTGLDPLGTNRSHYSVFDISRAREELGFEPVYDLEKGVKDYVEMGRILGLI